MISRKPFLLIYTGNLQSAALSLKCLSSYATGSCKNLSPWSRPFYRGKSDLDYLFLLQ